MTKYSFIATGHFCIGIPAISTGCVAADGFFLLSRCKSGTANNAKKLDLVILTEKQAYNVLQITVESSWAATCEKFVTLVIVLFFVVSFLKCITRALAQQALHCNEAD